MLAGGAAKLEGAPFHAEALRYSYREEFCCD